MKQIRILRKFYLNFLRSGSICFASRTSTNVFLFTAPCANW